MSLASQLSLAFARVGQEIKATRAGKYGKFYLNGAQSATGPANTVIGINAQSANDDTAYYALNAPGVTVKLAGLYVIQFTADMTASAAVSLFLTANGTTIQTVTIPSTARAIGSCIIRLGANTDLRLNTFSTGNITFNGTSDPQNVALSIARLGA